MKEQNEIGCLPAIILFFGGIFLIFGVIGINVESFITIPLGVFLILLGLNKQRDWKIKNYNRKKEEQEKS